MEPSLKTRLLGAAVLIALLVLFVPMLFSSAPPKGDTEQTVSLEIPPAPDRELQARTLDVSPNGTGAVSAPQPVTSAGRPAAPVAAGNAPAPPVAGDRVGRKSVGQGKSVDLGGRRIIKTNRDSIAVI